MHELTAILVGVLFASATYLVLQKSFVQILFGFGLLTHAANLLVLAMSGSPKGKISPIIKEGLTNFVDPTPQALILTAIVIGFAVTAFLVVLIYKIFLQSKSSFVEDEK